MNEKKSNLMIKPSNGGVIFNAKIIPNSSRTCLAGLLDGMLKIKVSAPPEKGKANKHLVEFLANQLGVRKKTVNIISGQKNSIKEIEVQEISVESVLKKLNIYK